MVTDLNRYGRSNPNAIKNAVRRAVEFCEAEIAQKVSDKLGEITPAEEVASGR